jgi:hypothetical protein
LLITGIPSRPHAVMFFPVTCGTAENLFYASNKKIHAIDYRVTGIASGILSFKGHDIVAVYRNSGSILAEFLADGTLSILVWCSVTRA